MMLVAVAMIGFTACDKTEEMSDEELINAVANKNMFYGKVSADNEDINGLWITAVFEADKTFTLYMTESRKEAKKEYSEDDIFDEGTWTVSDKKLVATSADDGAVYNFEISNSGKKLTLETSSFKVVLD